LNEKNWSKQEKPSVYFLILAFRPPYFCIIIALRNYLHKMSDFANLFFKTPVTLPKKQNDFLKSGFIDPW